MAEDKNNKAIAAPQYTVVKDQVFLKGKLRELVLRLGFPSGLPIVTGVAGAGVLIDMNAIDNPMPDVKNYSNVTDFAKDYKAWTDNIETIIKTLQNYIRVRQLEQVESESNLAKKAIQPGKEYKPQREETFREYVLTVPDNDEFSGLFSKFRKHLASVNSRVLKVEGDPTRRHRFIRIRFTGASEELTELVLRFFPTAQIDPAEVFESEDVTALPRYGKEPWFIERSSDTGTAVGKSKKNPAWKGKPPIDDANNYSSYSAIVHGIAYTIEAYCDECGGGPEICSHVKYLYTDYFNILEGNLRPQKQIIGDKPYQFKMYRIKMSGPTETGGDKDRWIDKDGNERTYFKVTSSPPPGAEFRGEWNKDEQYFVTDLVSFKDINYASLIRRSAKGEVPNIGNQPDKTPTAWRALVSENTSLGAVLGQRGGLGKHEIASPVLFTSPRKALAAVLKHAEKQPSAKGRYLPVSTKGVGVAYKRYLCPIHINYVAYEKGKCPVCKGEGRSTKLEEEVSGYKKGRTKQASSKLIGIKGKYTKK